MTRMMSEEQPRSLLEEPELGLKKPRAPRPAGEPPDPTSTGAAPDYFPGKPGSDLPRARLAARRRRRPRRLMVSWLQAH